MAIRPGASRQRAQQPRPLTLLDRWLRHVRGYEDEGTTTPFEMVALNDMDCYHLVMDVIERVPGLGSTAARLHQLMVDKRIANRAWTRAHGEDLPEVRDWSWP